MSSGRCSLGREEPDPDVEAPPLVLELADAHAADRGVDGLADVGHADAEVGRLVRGRESTCTSGMPTW